MIEQNVHFPYCELPLEARALFTIFGLAAAARFTGMPPRRATLDAMLNLVWDAERLTLNDLSDPHRITRLIEEYMASTGLPTRRCSRIEPGRRAA